MIATNIYEKELYIKLVIYKDYTQMHGQQNIKFQQLYWNTRNRTPTKYYMFVLQSFTFIRLKRMTQHYGDLYIYLRQ
jgi:hypothetical protein